MNSIETRIRKTIHAHNTLMLAYTNILKSIGIRGIFTSYEYELADPIVYIRNKELGLYEKFELVISAVNFYLDYRFLYYLTILLVNSITRKKVMNGPTKIYIKRNTIRPLVEYFLKTHIHRNLSKLYNIYLLEIMSQNQGIKNKDEIDELRNIASDVKNFADSLPSTKKFLATVAGFVVGIITVVEFFRLNSLLSGILPSSVVGYVIVIVIFIGIIVAFLLSFPIITAFLTKRAILLNTKNFYCFLDHYVPNSNETYSNSVYKLENDLYDIVGGRNQKPREIPIDNFVLMAAGIGIFTLFIGVAIITIEDFSKAIEPTRSIKIGGITLLVSVMGFVLFVGPYLDYRRRKIHNLV